MPNPRQESTSQPLYQQVRRTLTTRIADGIWAAGEALPSEHALAAELGVSQGTVRKALDALAAENVVLRRQGLGTFVPEQTPERSLFHFFRMTAPDGQRPTPTIEHEQTFQQRATKTQAAALDLPPSAPVTVIQRVRALLGRKATFETIVVSCDRMPGLVDTLPLPDALYSYYQGRYGIYVARAEDQLSAAVPDSDVARQLEISPDTPLLRAERRALDLNNAPVEWRVSLFLTKDLSYAVSLR